MAETASIDAQVVEEKKEALFSKKNRKRRPGQKKNY